MSDTFVPAIDTPVVDAVVIGRNEGARLIACLQSLQVGVRRVVYVDSGSTDGSVTAAQALGADVISLDTRQPFTAARARNAGLAALDTPDFVQLVDGDCAVDQAWLRAALDAFGHHPKAVVVCGRRRERFPQSSVYNRLIDLEWDTPLGSVAACGGDALVRFSAVMAVGGYCDDLIAGEEPEMCLRLRAAGGQIWRIGAEMTLHDAAIARFGQWWRRCVRAGHAFAEGASPHGPAGGRLWVNETRRAVVWGMIVPLIIPLVLAFHPAGAVLGLIYPLQVFRLSRRGGWQWATFTLIGKFAESWGVVGYWWGRVRGRKQRLIEYK